ncbi:hypothetical protein RIF29_33597 [Crotalaria pallida]|uniref:Uncharacterized protein n=1 Tax=Crotalaria pallida TaxID=3830 RepID=A0AAN9HSW6_CROPI
MIIHWTNITIRREHSFKFLNHITLDSEFINTVNSNWKQDGEEFAMFRLMRNLDNIRPGLRDLNNRKYKDIDMREIQARKRLDSIQDMLQLDPLNNHLQKMEKEARKEHSEVYHAAIMFLRQKAKQDWLCEGDLNTKFFHQSIRQRRYRNRVLRIQDNEGRVLTQQNDIEIAAFQRLIFKKGGS